MSVSIDLYPELLNPGRGLYLEVFNPTNTAQDVTLTFYADSTAILVVALEDVPSGVCINFVTPWSVLDLDDYRGRVVSVVPSIPTPGAGVYLLGTTVAPSTKGNAKIFRIASSTVTLTFKDPDGLPVANARVMLTDTLNGKTYLYTTDDEGRVYLPDRPAGSYGRWLLELYEPKPERGYVLYHIEEYDYTSKEVTVGRFRSAYVEIGLSMPKTEYARGLVENILSYMPEPLRTFVSLAAQGLGWLHDTILNAAFSYLAWQIGRSGHGVTSCKYDAGFMTIGFNVGLSSPFAFPGVAAFLGWLFKWFIGFAVAYIVVRVVESWTSVRIAEEQTKQMEILNQQISQLNKLLEEGRIDRDTYSKALDTIRGVKDYEASNTPTLLGIPVQTIVSLVLLVLLASVVASVVSAVKR